MKINKIGNGIDGRIYFEYETENEIENPRMLAFNKQLEAGYHPAGYDCFNVRLTSKEGVNTLTWESSASCD